MMNLDLSKLALPQDFQNMTGAKKLWTNIPVRKPSKTEFFRVLDDDNYTIRTAIIELKEEKPELTVLVAELSAERLYELQHESSEFFCDMIVQTDICLDDELNDVLR